MCSIRLSLYYFITQVTAQCYPLIEWTIKAMQILLFPFLLAIFAISNNLLNNKYDGRVKS
jgi:hypothetical protein